MKQSSMKLRNWVIEKIKSDYPEDIDLLLAVHGHNVNKDDHGEVFDYFVPASERGCALAETFILDGIGHDLYPRSWERLQRTANLEEGQVFTLGNAEIVYARNDDARKKFEQICARLNANLHNSSFTHHIALKQLEMAMDIYKTLIFEDKLYQIRLGSGLIIYYLNNAAAYINETFLSQLDATSQLKSMSRLPENFLSYEESILHTADSNELKLLCYKLIQTFRNFVSGFANTFSVETAKEKMLPDFHNLAAWYQELSLCWKRIYYFCEINDYIKAYEDAVYLQSELNIIRTEFHLKEMDLLSAFDFENLSELSVRAHEFEQYILETLQQNTIPLNTYQTIEEFLEAH